MREYSYYYAPKMVNVLTGLEGALSLTTGQFFLGIRV